MLVSEVVIGEHPTLPRVLNTQKNGLMELTAQGVKLADGTVITWALIKSFKPTPKLEKPVAEEAKPRRKTPARRGRPKKRAPRED